MVSPDGTVGAKTQQLYSFHQLAEVKAALANGLRECGVAGPDYLS